MRPFDDEFERSDEGTLIASEKTILDRRGWHVGLRGLRTFLIGRPISTDHEEHERLTKTKALAVFSSDNISSSAYGPEEIMRVLALAGVASLFLSVQLAALIIVMLAIVTVSYRQTIKAYPMGASSYIVASDNLGDRAGIVAASALLIGYTVTVAVSVSAGVLAMTSIIPQLDDYKVPISVALVALLMLGNLRGIRESGAIFMTPTYLYIAVMLGVIGWGLVQALTGTLAQFQPPAGWVDYWETSGQALGLFLILRAFSQGAVALTGVEAVSDGVPAFKPPEWKNARTTLTWAAIVFGILFLGIAYLATRTGIVPDPEQDQTVLSLLVRQIAGDGAILILAQVATALILVLAANTSFADFPRLSSFLARDGFLPRQFAFRGERLAFTTGIIALSGMAIGLLIIFKASVSGLIPLYTLGVFIAFTLSQSGMFARWYQRREPGWVRGMVINGLGAATTGVVMLVVGVSNFTQRVVAGDRAGPDPDDLPVRHPPPLPQPRRSAGARAHPARQGGGRRADRDRAGGAAGPHRAPGDRLRQLDQQDRHRRAHHQQPRVGRRAARTVADWAGSTELVVVESPYRALVGPLLRYMDALQAQDPGRPVLVVLSEVVPRHWWENLLHNQTALRLKLRLFARPNTIVADVPYHLPIDESKRPG